MRRDGHDEIQALFDELVELGAEERSGRLALLSESDPALAAEMVSLLAADQRADELFRPLRELTSPGLVEVTYEPHEGTARADPLGLIGRTVSHYEVVELLGVGGMGVLYKAEDARLDRTVALKFLPPQWSLDTTFKERFRREARAVAALDYPTVCNIHEIGETEEGQLFIAMAFYEGETLREKIARGPLAVDKALDLAEQAAGGLAAAHAAGLVHRDIKPANLMVTEQGLLKILDFGLAKTADTSLTEDGMRLGTPAYMSPEQTRGEEVDGRTDLWSLGVVLYEMLTGRRPFRGDRNSAVIHAIRHDEPEPPGELREGVPPEVDTLVLRLLAKDPEDRYTEATQLGAELGVPLPQITLERRPRHERFLTRRRALLGSAAALILLGLWVGSDPILRVDPLKGDPSIAVLPFTVSGADEEPLREGLVSLLSTNLDGVGGLRAIDSRTVLAQWDRYVEAGERPDLETGLRVARASGARYALVGSAVSTGPTLQLTGSVYEVETGAALGQVRAAGSVDSIWTVVDGLSVETLRSLADAGVADMAEVDLAGATTRSPQALRAFLDGEESFRHSDFNAAISSFEQALEADSSFALAHYRLGQSLRWRFGVARSELISHFEAALEGPLPERKAQVARAFRSWMRGGEFANLDSVRRAFRRYPDDADSWFMLGQLYLHLGATRVVDDYLEVAERALTQATQLDPGFAPHYLDLVRLAFWAGDSLKAAEHVEMYGRAAPGSSLDRTHRILHRLVFGNVRDQAEFDAGIDSLAALGEWSHLRNYLSGSLAAHVAEPIWLRFSEAIGNLPADACLATPLSRGQWQKFLTYATHREMRARNRISCLYVGFLTGLPVPEELLDQMVADAAEMGTSWWTVYAGAYDAARGRWQLYEEALGRLKAVEAEARSHGDSAQARRWRFLVRTLEGIGLAERGETEAAVQMLESVPTGYHWPVNRWWLGRLYLDLDRPAHAARYFSTFRGGGYPWSHASYYLGQAYEKLGDVDQAIEAYTYFLDAWKYADAELQPLVEQAQQRLDEIFAARG